MFKPIIDHQYAVIDNWYDNDTMIYYITDLTAMRCFYLRECDYIKYRDIFN